MTPIFAVLLGASLLMPQATIAAELENIAEQHNIPASVFVGIAMCESKLNKNALNPNDHGSPSYGLFQFKKGTFYGNGGKNIWSWEDQAETAARMMEEGGYKHWKNCWKQTMVRVQEYAVATALNEALTSVDAAQKVISN